VPREWHATGTLHLCRHEGRGERPVQLGRLARVSPRIPSQTVAPGRLTSREMGQQVDRGASRVQPSR
jgi:hypothetical protein